MYCFKCGKIIDADSAFCRHCGAGIPSSSAKGPDGGVDQARDAAAIVNNPSPKIIQGRAEPGQGIHNYILDGVWEASAKVDGARLSLRFSVNNREPFSGWQESRGRFGKVLERNEIVGNCHLILDGNVLLGLHLEGFKDQSEPFELEIPIHRRVGSMFIGITENGESWSSHNVDPQKD